MTLEEKTLSTYLDGELCAMVTSEIYIAINTDEDDLWLGSRPGNEDGTNFLKMIGKMDRVRIWDIALTDDQVYFLYKSKGAEGGTAVSPKPEHNLINGFSLQQNYPNPFNPTTTISYSIDNISTHVNMRLYNLKGQQLMVLIDEVQSAGQHQFVLNGQNLQSGVYLLKMTAGDFSTGLDINLVK